MIKYNILIILFLFTQHRTHTHTHTHTTNQELHMRPHLPRFYRNTLLQGCW